MTIKTAWLLEEGEENIKKVYSRWFPELDPVFFWKPEGVLEGMKRTKYGLFVVGLSVPSAPYEVPEDEDIVPYAGLRLIDDIRSDPRHKNSPIIVSSECAVIYENEILAKGAAPLDKPWTQDDFRRVMETVMKNPVKPL